MTFRFMRVQRPTPGQGPCHKSRVNFANFDEWLKSHLGHGNALIQIKNNDNLFCA